MTWDPRTWFRVDPSINQTAYKAVWSVRLWIGTFVVFAVAVFASIHVEEVFFGSWLAGLSGFSGFAYVQYKTQRQTDYGFVERKAGMPPTGTTTETPTP